MNTLPFNLTRPLIVFDVESTAGYPERDTGPDPSTDLIVSLSALKIYPDGTREPHDTLVNPGVPINKERSEIHGITDEMVKDAPKFKAISKAVHTLFSVCDLCGFNATNYDIPILWEHFYRCGIEWDLTGVRFIDPGTIFKKFEPRDLTSARKFYCKASHENAHSARADVEATLDVLCAQCLRYDELFEASMEELAEQSQQEKRLDLAGVVVVGKEGLPVFTHKKVRGVKVRDDIGYAEWILRSDFSVNTKQVIRKLLSELR